MLNAYLGDGRIRITRELPNSLPEDIGEWTYRGDVEGAREFLEDHLIYMGRPGTWNLPKRGSSVLWSRVEYVAQYPAATLHALSFGYSTDETRSTWKANNSSFHTGGPQTWIDVAHALTEAPQEDHRERLIVAYAAFEDVPREQAVADLWFKNGNPRRNGRRGSIREGLERILDVPVVQENIEELADYYPWIARRED